MVNYGLESTSAVERILSLHWVMVIRVIRVNAHGQSIDVVKRMQKDLGVVTDEELGRTSFFVGLSPQSAFYRVDLSIRKQNGDVLGRYGQYLRVLRPKVSVQLKTDIESVAPGGILRFRVQNPGTTDVVYGEPFEVEKYEEGWTDYLGEADLGPWRRVLFRVLAGRAGGCQQVNIPLDALAGRYRVRKDLARSNRSVSAEFVVASQ